MKYDSLKVNKGEKHIAEPYNTKPMPKYTPVNAPNSGYPQTGTRTEGVVTRGNNAAQRGLKARGGIDGSTPKPNTIGKNVAGI